MEFNRLAIIVGSLLPDIIDKTLLFLNLGSGRDLSHTLIFNAILFLLLLIIFRDLSISSSYFIGAMSHLFLDMPYVPILSPFLEYEVINVEDPIRIWLNTLMTNPIVIITEIIGIVGLIYIVIRNKLYKYKKLYKFLFENSDKNETKIIVLEQTKKI